MQNKIERERENALPPLPCTPLKLTPRAAHDKDAAAVGPTSVTVALPTLTALPAALVVLITQAFVLIFCSAFFAFSRFVCLFCVFAKCFVVLRFFSLFAVVLCSFLATLLFILHVFSLFNLRLLPVLVFGKLFSGSPDKNTHTIYQLGLEFSVFFCFFFTSFVVFRFFVVSGSLLSHLSSFISIENV